MAYVNVNVYQVARGEDIRVVCDDCMAPNLDLNGFQPEPWCWWPVWSMTKDRSCDWCDAPIDRNVVGRENPVRMI